MSDSRMRRRYWRIRSSSPAFSTRCSAPSRWRTGKRRCRKPVVTFGVVQSPADVIRDPQLFENEMIVPIQGAGGNLKSTVSSPIQVRDVTKVPAKRAPELGEHNEEILRELGFNATEIDSLRSTAVPDAKHLEAVGAAGRT